MKNLSFLLSVVVVMGVGAEKAHAGKLNLSAIQGQYESIVTPHMSIACPETITVVYDAANATLDSEAFHFANIGRKAQDEGQDFDPDHASYSDAWTKTKLTSNSIVEDQDVNNVTSDTSGVPIFPEPLDPTIGAGGVISSAGITETVLKYDSRKKTLAYFVTVDGYDADEGCSYVRSK
jgi:hypothetical protein